MPHKWLALDDSYAAWQPPADRAPLIHEPLVLPEGLMHGAPLGVRCGFEALPFAGNSLDLVVLPHALELAHDPHATLREVERVLVPEGRVVIAGFNPASLWGVWQRLGLWGVDSALVVPRGDFIAYWRLRDWLQLLNLEVETGGFGCYRPMVDGANSWERLRWMEHAGDRWWPVLGAVYFVVAVKRVRGMRLLGKLKQTRAATAAAPVAVAQRHQRDGHVQQD